MGEMDLKKAEYYTNRELSWLGFNNRILGEARDASLPLFERLKFLSITASNLDEFFMIRVASLKDMVHAGYTKKDISGMTASEQLKKILKETHELVDLQYSTYNRSLIPALKKRGLKIISEHESLSEEQKKFVDAYFEENVYPVLTPMAMDSSRPFPLIRNKTLNIGALICRKDGKESIRHWILQRCRYHLSCQESWNFRKERRRKTCDSSGRDHRAEHRTAVFKLRCRMCTSIPCYAKCRFIH